MTALKRLSIAYTPDSDDAFCFDALETGGVRLPGWRLVFRREPVSVLNRAALAGLHDVTAISSVIYPQIAHNYAILSVGASVGRLGGQTNSRSELTTLRESPGRVSP